MTILLFLSAMSLSSIAAYYAIMGLMAIFSGASLSIAIMGGALEVAKLVIASWIYRNWKETSWLLKSYFVAAIVVLMSLTSMGIFGFLSKAHSDQSMITGDVQYKLEAIDEKIKLQKEKIDVARKTLIQLDEQVNETLRRTAGQDNNAGVNRSISVRRAQSRERAALSKEITSSQEEISKLNEERSPLAKESRQVEAEVGPIKYIAALIYEDNHDVAVLEKAVRVMILMIVGVFDPLAVLMFIAFNQTMMRKKQPSTQEPAYEKDDGPLTEEQIEQIKETVIETSIVEVETNLENNKHVLKMADRIILEDDVKFEKIKIKT